MRPDDRKYLKSHEWCKIDDDVATLGITDFAVDRLSDLIFLDLPAPGTRVVAGRPFGEIESVKAVFDLLSPVGGEVVEVNNALVETLEKLASDPFTDAWMIKVKLTGDVPGLLDAAGYEQHCQAESE